MLFLRKVHSTEHPSWDCHHLVLISQLSRLKQWWWSVLLKDTTYWCRVLNRQPPYPETIILTTWPISSTLLLLCSDSLTGWKTLPNTETNVLNPVVTPKWWHLHPSIGNLNNSNNRLWSAKCIFHAQANLHLFLLHLPNPAPYQPPLKTATNL